MAIPVLTSLDFNNVAKITNLPTPTAAGDAATKGYVDSAIEGLAWKDNVRVATQANINLLSPGATVDGVTLSNGDRVLVRAQTTTSENGIYIYNGAATPMTRSLDASTGDELENAITTADEGTSAGSSFRQTAVDITLGTTPIAFTAFGVVAPAATESTAGIAEIATQAEVNALTDDARFITPLKLANWTGRIKKFTQDIGDGSATSYTVTHNFGSRDITVQVYRNSGNYENIFVDVRRSSINAVQIVFDAAPTTNQYRVVITG